MTLVVKASRDPQALAAAMRREVRSLDPALPFYNVLLADDLVADSLTYSRLVAFLVSAFSLLALLLASVGIYGVMLSHLAQRTKELGLRMALGSRLRGIVWLVMREGLVLVLIGLAAGGGAALLGSRLLASFLFGLDRFDPASYGAAALVLSGICLSGCLVLLRRIKRLDPMTALRYD